MRPGEGAETGRPRIRLGAAALRVLPVVVVVGAVLVQAAGLPVERHDRTEAIFAERREVADRFLVTETRLDRAPLDLDPRGTTDDPVEITELMTPAWTLVAAGNWTYTAVVQERAPGSVAGGNYTVDLSLDGTRRGVVHLAQAIANPALAEGARVVFDIGDRAPIAPLFVVTVRSPAPPDSVHRLKTIDCPPPGSGSCWEGADGDVAGVVNPTLQARVDVPLEITIVKGSWTEDSAGIHNVGVQDDAGTLEDPPGWSDDVDEDGEEVTLRWTPGQPGTYTYICEYHTSTMVGEIEVTT